ncbi:hypothetical protein CCR75_009409 [Bremia lactucae]|uniref:L-ectoine synthase n=1 Tax=Bremia lactucae TaxID=4779 RepID=A0A976IH47_BRELC|nr:hypothetical protein CCR75_009409 [Bremia lactucae]
MLRLFRIASKVSAPRTRPLHNSAPSSFLLRSLEDVRQSGRVITSIDDALETRRYLVRSDACGFSLQHEVLKKGAPVRLEYRNHVYALLVTRGNGSVRLLDVGKGPSQTQHVSEGSLVALNAAEAIEIEVESDELHAVSVMNPPVFGAEQRHDATGVFPVVDKDGEAYESFDLSQVDHLFSAPDSLKGGSAPMKDDPLF